MANNKKGFVLELEVGNYDSTIKPLDLTRKYDDDMAWSIWKACCNSINSTQINGNNWRWSYNEDFLIPTGAPKIVSKVSSFISILPLRRTGLTNEYLNFFVEQEIDNRDKVKELETKLDELLDDDEMNPVIKNTKRIKYERLIWAEKDKRDTIASSNREGRHEQGKELVNPEKALDASQIILLLAFCPQCANGFDTFHSIEGSFKQATGKGDFGVYAGREEDFSTELINLWNNLSAEEQALTISRFIYRSFSAWSQRLENKMVQVKEENDEVDYDDLMTYAMMNYQDDCSNDPKIMPIDYATREISLHSYILFWFDKLVADARRSGKSSKWILGAKSLRHFIAERDYLQIDWRMCKNDIRKGCGLNNKTAQDIINWIRNGIEVALKRHGHSFMTVIRKRNKTTCLPFFESHPVKNELTFEDLKAIADTALDNLKTDFETGLMRKHVFECAKMARESLLRYIDGGEKPLTAWRVVHDMYNNTPWDCRIDYPTLQSDCMQAYDLYEEEIEFEFEKLYEKRFSQNSDLTFLEYLKELHDEYYGKPEPQEYEPIHSFGRINKFSNPNGF